MVDLSPPASNLVDLQKPISSRLDMHVKISFQEKKKTINLNPSFDSIILHNGKITSCPVSTLVLKIKLIYVVNFDGTQTIMYTRPQIFEDLIRRLQITIVKHQSTLLTTA